MEFRTYGFGLYGWHGDGLAVVGGVREEGYHGPGTLRCGFAIMDTKRADANGSALQVGKASIVIRLASGEGDEPRVEKLIDVEITKEERRKGYGRKAVLALADISGGRLEICDIRKGAEPFWRGVGAEGFRREGGRLHAWLPAGQHMDDAERRRTDVEEGDKTPGAPGKP